jgi:hypothetical protein
MASLIFIALGLALLVIAYFFACLTSFTWDKLETQKLWRRLILVLIIVLVIFFFPKPCGKWTTAASSMMEYKCYGIKTLIPLASPGGGPFFCLGVYNPFKKEPSFGCTEATDCISGCGWRATYGGIGGCIAVNKNSKDYLEHNNLKTEEKFPLVCQKNNCAFRVEVKNDIFELGVNEAIIGFKEGETLHITPYFLIPENAWITPEIFFKSQ